MRKLTILTLSFFLLVSACTGFDKRYDTTTLTPPSIFATAATIQLTSPPPAAPALLADIPYTWGDRESFRSGLTSAQFAELGSLTAAPEYHIQLSISADLKAITGRQLVQYTNQSSEKLSEIVFRIYPALFGSPVLIENILVDGLPAQSTRYAADSALKISLPEQLAQNDTVIVALDFSYTMPEDPSGNYLIFAATPDLLTLAHFYPMLAIREANGWSDEIPPTYGDVSYTDAAFYIVRVSAPADLQLVASGVEINQGSSENEQIIDFAAGPARDFFLAAGRNLQKVSLKVDDLVVNSYAPAKYAQGNQKALEVAARALKIHTDLIGAYPYTEFDVIATHTEALGVEYPGLTTINNKLYDLDSTINQTPAAIYLESTIAHEVGHMWFYNTVGNDQVQHPWMDESLTQYITYLYYRESGGKYSAEGFLNNLYDRWTRVEQRPIPIGMPVENYTPPEYGAIVYGRGPIFFHELELLMGNAKMENFLHDYYRDYTWKNATPANIEASLETACSCSLSGWFLKWVQ